MMAARLELDHIDWSSFAANGFAEAVFAELLGAQSLTSIDYSDYRDVDVVHDLNTPLPIRLHGAFDAVVDGGTMEHIVDVKEVLANYMNMVKVGDSLHNDAGEQTVWTWVLPVQSRAVLSLVRECKWLRSQRDGIIELPSLSVEASPRVR